MDTSLSVAIAVTVVLVAAVAVYMLFRDFSLGTSTAGERLLELRRPALVDDAVAPPRVAPRPPRAAAPAVPPMHTSLAPPSPLVPPAPPVASTTRTEPAARSGADTWAELWAARKRSRPYLRCRDGEDLLGREPVPAPGSTPSGLEHFMSEVDLAMGSHQRPRRAAHANRPAATDQGVKVLPYSQRDTTPPPVNE